MTPKLDIPAHLTQEQAKQLQSQLAPQIVTQDRFDRIEVIAGLDVAYAQRSSRAVAAAVILRASDLAVLETRTRECVVDFPYVPGLFSWRELPALCAVLREVTTVPDLLICDGQGIAHPRRFGLACHIGLMFDVPTIGCAKTSLVAHDAEPDAQRGSSAPLLNRGETVGCALRTRSGVKPIYVSPGHRISVQTACEWALRLAARYRIPEPLRLADQAARRGLSSEV